MSRCGHCAAAKVKQSNANKNSDHVVSSMPGERIFGNTAIAKKPKLFDVTIDAPNWWMIVDELSQTKFSAFYSRKNQMVEPSCRKFSKWKQSGNKVEFFRCDNA